MADQERLTTSLQLAVLAVLVYDLKEGAKLAAQLKTTHFDNQYRDFAGMVLAYRARHRKPPGKAELGDLLERAFLGRERNALRERIEVELTASQDGLNPVYIAGRVIEFIRKQTLKATLIAASDRFNRDDEEMVGEVEGILHSGLSGRIQQLDTGVFLNSPSALAFLDRDQLETIPLGIPALDAARISLSSQQLLLYIAAKGTGKSWFCVHAGKQALMHHANVVHISLEMSADEVLQRYFQAFFAIAQTDEEFWRWRLVKGDKAARRRIVPERHFASSGIRRFLTRQMKEWGGRFQQLVVKNFPTGSLTVPQLVGYLNTLELVHNFIPKVVIIDYPKLMRTDPKNLRIDLGRTIEELRGLAVSRNFALIAPHQGTRATLDKEWVRASHASEDISLVQTADTVLTFSATAGERSRNLGRLSVAYVRNRKSGLTIYMTQSYATGQYIVSSKLVNDELLERMRKLTGDAADDESEN